jgi:hypothetical protein
MIVEVSDWTSKSFWTRSSAIAELLEAYFSYFSFFLQNQGYANQG